MAAKLALALAAVALIAAPAANAKTRPWWRDEVKVNTKPRDGFHDTHCGVHIRGVIYVEYDAQTGAIIGAEQGPEHKVDSDGCFTSRRRGLR